MRGELEEVLLLQTEYTSSNTPAMKRRGELIRTVMASELRSMLPALADGLNTGDLKVEGRDATGLKAEIPWIRIYSRSRSPSATTGWYVVYLFSAGGDRVYLSLNQAATQWDGSQYRPRSEEELDGRVARARQLLANETDLPSHWLETIRLDGRPNGLGPRYERGNVVAVEYALDSIPTDERISSDLVTFLGLLDAIYAAEDEGGLATMRVAPEIAEMEAVIDISASNARGRRQGFHLNTAEKLAIEKHAVDVASAHLKSMGYRVTDVGTVESFDLDARRSRHRLKVEVKGTTSQGSEIILTPNEVQLHLDAFPDNALALVHSIQIDYSADPPTAFGGCLEFKSPWALDSTKLTAMSFRYPTGF